MLILGFFACPACGRKHEAVQFRQSRPGEAEWVGECPATKEEIKLLIVAVRPDDRPGPGEAGEGTENDR